MPTRTFEGSFWYNTYMNILITGTAGYIGGMLAHQYAQRTEVDQVICVDKERCPEWLENQDKLVWITAHLLNDDWEEQVDRYHPSVVIHAAWQIRDWYGGRSTVREWNIESSRRVFEYVFNTDSVERMVYFSSIAQYGAARTNTDRERFTEESPTRLTGYCYADDKYEVDELLVDMYQNATVKKPVMVIKPSTVTGPRGRVGVGKFSLAAALSSDANKSAIPCSVQWMLSFMPVIGRWTRQFVHEDDITDAVAIGAFGHNYSGFHTYIVSPNDIIDGKTMANLTGKRAIPIPAVLARIGFGTLWHTTRGKIPTAPHVWKFMAYPICVDGTKITQEQDFSYSYNSRQAISELKGRYQSKKGA